MQLKAVVGMCNKYCRSIDWTTVNGLTKKNPASSAT